MIVFEDVNKSYGTNTVLNGLSFRVEAGEFAVLVGASGCGKTTTLKLINRLEKFDTGQIFINGKNIMSLDPIKLRRSIGYVIQSIGLFPTMTVEQNICVVPKLLKYSKNECKKIAGDMLELVNMPYEDFAHKYPHQLSGGQQQRVGVLRALAASPPIVLMDEPFGALDPITRSVLQEEVKKLQQKLEKTIVFVTHDMDEAVMLADKVIFMDAGKILQAATPYEILNNPADEKIVTFLGNHVNDQVRLQL